MRDRVTRWGVPGLAVLSCVAFGGWFWTYGSRWLEPAYDLSRVPDQDEVAAALRESCGRSASGSDLVPALRLPPDYPERARRSGIEGSVELEFLVSPEGTVSEVRVTTADPPSVFDLAAVHAVSNWHYCPRAEATRSRVRLAFEVDEPEDQFGECQGLAALEDRVRCWVQAFAGG